MDALHARPRHRAGNHPLRGPRNPQPRRRQDRGLLAALVREFAQLSPPKVYDALSCYYDHQDEIDQEIAKNTERVWCEAK